MAAGEADEDIFEAGLPGGEMQQSGSSPGDGLEESRNGDVGLAHGEGDEAVIRARVFDAGKGAPGFEVAVRRSTGVAERDGKFDNVLAAQALDQIGRRSLSDDLAVVDDGEAVAEALGFVHVMRGEKHGAAAALELADDLPQLAAALGIETGGRLVEEENARIGDERRGDGQALALSAGKFSYPGVGLLGEAEFGEDLGGGERLAVEAGEELDGFADGELFRQASLLQGDAQPLAELLGIGVPPAAEDAHFAGSGLEQAFKDFDGRGLAGAVGAEQAEALAFANLEVEATQGFDLGVVSLAQAAALDGGGQGLDCSGVYGEARRWDTFRR